MTHSRPRWLTVQTAAGEDIHMRLPEHPTVDNMQSMLAKISELARRHTAQMRNLVKPHRHLRGWARDANHSINPNN